MAYELHIERAEQAIPLADWQSAVRGLKGVRLTTEGAVAVNPATGEEIRIGSEGADAQVLFESGGFLGLGRKKEWITVFRFSDGRASFKGTLSVESTKDPVHRAAAHLALKLGASIVGDEGETYEWKG